MGESFTHRPMRGELVGRQCKHNDGRMRAFLKKFSQPEVPVEIMRLFNRETADLVLRRQVRAQRIDRDALQEQRVPNKEDGRPAISGHRLQFLSSFQLDGNSLFRMTQVSKDEWR